MPPAGLQSRGRPRGSSPRNRWHAADGRSGEKSMVRSMACSGAGSCLHARRRAHRIRTGRLRAGASRTSMSRSSPRRCTPCCTPCSASGATATMAWPPRPGSNSPSPTRAMTEITAFGLKLMDLVDRRNPERSLLLRKPTNRVKHTGGQRIKPGSDEEKPRCGAGSTTWPASPTSRSAGHGSGSPGPSGAAWRRWPCVA